MFLQAHDCSSMFLKFNATHKFGQIPDQFCPQRFLTSHKDVDVKGQYFELIPFSSGRTMCPGANLALQIMQLILANLLHKFEISTPSTNQLICRKE